MTPSNPPGRRATSSGTGLHVLVVAASTLVRETAAAALAASPRVRRVTGVRSASAAAVVLAGQGADAVVVHHDEGGDPSSLDRLAVLVGARTPALVLLATDPGVAAPVGRVLVRTGLPLSALDGRTVLAALLIALDTPARPPQRPEQPQVSPQAHPAVPVPRRGGRTPSVLVLGASTGGPDAVAVLLRSLHPSTTVPVLVAQHIGADFSSLLVERLATCCPLPVREAVDAEEPAPGVVLVPPGDRHLEVRRRCGRAVLAVHDGPREHSCRPAVDPLLRSAAATFGDGVLAVVLTGMGSDGLAGARAVRDAGGTVLVQDEATSVVWGMPGRIAREGAADAVLPLDALAADVARRLRPAAVDAVAPD